MVAISGFREVDPQVSNYDMDSDVRGKTVKKSKAGCYFRYVILLVNTDLPAIIL